MNHDIFVSLRPIISCLHDDEYERRDAYLPYVSIEFDFQYYGDIAASAYHPGEGGGGG